MIRTIAGLAVLLVLAGCSSIRGYPDRSEDEDVALDFYKARYSVTNNGCPKIAGEKGNGCNQLEEYFNGKFEEGEKEILRNRIVYANMYIIDINYAQFRKNIYREATKNNIIFDIMSFGASAAGAITTSADASRILSGITGSLTGAKTSLNKTLYVEKTMPSVIKIMEAERTNVKTRIIAGLSRPDSQYPLEAALSDMEAYFQAGSLPAAFAAISAAAEEKKKTVEVRLDKVEDGIVNASKSLAEIEKSIKMVDALNQDQVDLLLNNPPSRETNTQIQTLSTESRIIIDPDADIEEKKNQLKRQISKEAMENPELRMRWYGDLYGLTTGAKKSSGTANDDEPEQPQE